MINRKNIMTNKKKASGKYRSQRMLPKCIRTWEVNLVTAITRLAPLVYNAQNGKDATDQKLYGVIIAQLKKAGVKPTNGKNYGSAYGIFHILRALDNSRYMPYGNVSYDNLVEAITNLCMDDLHIIDFEDNRKPGRAA